MSREIGLGFQNSHVPLVKGWGNGTPIGPSFHRFKIRRLKTPWGSSSYDSLLPMQGAQA